MLPSPPLVFDQVSYSIAGRRILDRLSFTVQPGETLVLLGASGSGKSTALRLVNGLLRPETGEVRVEGRAVSNWDPIELRRRIGYVIQEGGLFPHWTVRRNIALGPRLAGWDPARIDTRVDELLHRAGLPPAEFASRYPRQLSGGQRQRVGVARALAAHPPILLFDEPFSALDALTRAAAQRNFLELREAGSAALFVTHDLREALRVGTRVLLLDQGRAVMDRPAAGIWDSPPPLLAAMAEAAGYSA